MKPNKFLVVALLSVTLLSLELVWTRIFSAEYFYTFAFLILSLAILGLGLGALALHLSSGLMKKDNLGLMLTLSAFATILGPTLVFQLGLDFNLIFSFEMILKTILTVILLGLPYFFGGIVLAKIFKQNYEEMPKLYMYDLIGAGIGVILAVFLMEVIGTPMTTYLIALPVLYIALVNSKGLIRISAIVITLAVFILSTIANNILEVKKDEPAPVIAKHWDAMSKLKIYEFNERVRSINIDNHASTKIIKFDGNFNVPDSAKVDFFGINVGYLIRRFPNCSFLALGAGGGMDVMHALIEGAKEVHAVEVNPYINYLMTNGSLADYTGHLYKDPRVKVVTEDARAYVRRFNNKFDIIFSWSSNSYAALASGAFALAENYIYTTEAFKDYWNSLSDNGFLVIEHHFYVPRMISEMRDALKDLGVTNIESRFAVYDMPEWRRQLLLLSKQPLPNEILNNAIGGLGREHHNIRLLYPASPQYVNSLINQIVVRGWENVADMAKYDISPCTDDRPFTPQMGLWRNLTSEKLGNIDPFEEFMGIPVAKLIIVMILAIVIIIILPLNLIPFLKGKKYFTKYNLVKRNEGGLVKRNEGDLVKRKDKGKNQSIRERKFLPILYFFLIGMAFMMVEVILIQKYTLLIGTSIYSIVAILLTLLVSSGIGSRFSDKFNDKIAFGAIILLLLFDVFISRNLIYTFGSMGLFSRIFLTIILTAPLGFFMGMPFPKGALRVGKVIDWGFAVNGVGSVLGSAFIVLFAFSYGFSLSLLIAGFLYFLAFLLIIFKNFEI